VPAARLILARRKLLARGGAARAGIYGILHVSEVAKVGGDVPREGLAHGSPATRPINIIHRDH